MNLHRDFRIILQASREEIEIRDPTQISGV